MPAVMQKHGSRIFRKLHSSLRVESSPGIGCREVIPFSSQTKQGRDELWEVIDSFVLPQEETEEEDK